MPGTDWAFVRGTDTQWVAGSFVNGEYTYWWGNDTEPHLIEGYFQQGLDASPEGGYWAGIRTQGGQGLLTGADTQPGGEGFGETPIDQSGSGSPPWVAAVTDDGLVITGNGPTILWRPLVDGETVDLADTAPDQVVVDNTRAGLVVVDATSADIDGARNGDVYLADISPEGEISRLGSVPNNDDLAASNAWVSWVEAGATGGELTAIGQLGVQRLDGSDPGTLVPPKGWMFRTNAGTWEDDDHLVAVVAEARGEGERMVRCSPATEECVLLDTP